MRDVRTILGEEPKFTPQRQPGSAGLEGLIYPQGDWLGNHGPAPVGVSLETSKDLGRPALNVGGIGQGSCAEHQHPSGS